MIHTDKDMNFGILDRLRVEYHLRQIIQLDRNCFGGKRAWNKMQFLADLPGKWSLSLLAKQLNEVQGFAIASCFNSQFVHLHRIAVANDSQGRGVGKELIRAVEAAAKSNGLTAFTLECPCDLKVDDFYRSVGFRQASKEFTHEYLCLKKKVESAHLYLPIDGSSRRIFLKSLT